MLTRKRACAWEANLFLALLWLGRRGKNNLWKTFIYNNKSTSACQGNVSDKGMDMGSIICPPD